MGLGKKCVGKSGLLHYEERYDYIPTYTTNEYTKRRLNVIDENADLRVQQSKLPIQLDNVKLNLANTYIPRYVKKEWPTFSSIYQRFNSTIRVSYIEMYSCKGFKDVTIVSAKRLWSVYQDDIWQAGLIKSFLAEDMTEPLLTGEELMVKARVFQEVRYLHVCVKKEIPAMQFNQQVGRFSVPLRRLVGKNPTKLELALWSEWHSELAVVGIVQVANSLTAGEEMHTDGLFKVASAENRVVFEAGDNVKGLDALVDTASMTVVQVPLPEGPVKSESDNLFAAGIDQILEEYSIKEPYYLRHIPATDEGPSEVVVIPESFAERGTQRIFPGLVTPRPTRTAHRSPVAVDSQNPDLLDIRTIGLLEEEHTKNIRRLDQEMSIYHQIIESCSGQWNADQQTYGDTFYQ